MWDVLALVLGHHCSMIILGSVVSNLPPAVRSMPVVQLYPLRHVCLCWSPMRLRTPQARAAVPVDPGAVHPGGLRGAPQLQGVCKRHMQPCRVRYQVAQVAA